VQDPSRLTAYPRKNFMNSDQPVVLVVGATGRTGRLIVEAAARHEMQPRALVRDPDPTKEEPTAQSARWILAQPERMASV
jgi:uncharacterized protein YbjT (DUF2867 family)